MRGIRLPVIYCWRQQPSSPPPKIGRSVPAGVKPCRSRFQMDCRFFRFRHRGLTARSDFIHIFPERLGALHACSAMLRLLSALSFPSSLRAHMRNGPATPPFAENHPDHADRLQISDVDPG